MRHLINALFCVAAVFSFAVLTEAQSAPTASAPRFSSDISKSRLILASPVELSAMLVKVIDSKSAKVGGEVMLKVMKTVKIDGRIAVERGEKVMGRIVEVRSKANDTDHSAVAFMIDRIDRGGSPMYVAAAVRGFTPPAIEDSFDAPALNARESPGSAQPAFHCDCHGGGGAAETTPQRTNRAIGEQEPAGITQAGGVLRGLSFSQTTEGPAAGLLTMKMPGKNFRIERGSVFSLVIAEILPVAQN